MCILVKHVDEFSFHIALGRVSHCVWLQTEAVVLGSIPCIATNTINKSLHSGRVCFNEIV